MSGGSMDYVCWRIGEAASRIQSYLANEELRLKHKRYSNVCKHYADENPGVEYLKSDEALQRQVVKYMREALKVVREAAIYAERIEWFTSGDDGPESFCLRLEEELKENKKHGGVV